jgi:hypothetical protein
MDLTRVLNDYALKPMNNLAIASVDLIKKINSHIPWWEIATTIGTIVALYLNHIPAIAGILIGYTFSKAKDQNDRELDKIMKAITEFILKHTFLALFLGAINPFYTIPCIHFYCSLNIGRFMRGGDIQEPKEFWDLPCLRSFKG